jgi:hypothetical protein
LSANFDRTAPADWQLLRCLIQDFGQPQLFRIESERLRLPTPFSRRIAKPLDANATGQATFYGCFDKVGCEKGERDRHVDLANAALLASAKLGDVGYSTRDHIIQPLAASRDSADQARAAFKLSRSDFASRCIMREQDPAGSFGRWLMPGNREGRIVRAIGFVVCVIRLKSND